MMMTIPSVVVDLVSVTWSVHNVQAQAHSVLLDDCSDFSMIVRTLLRAAILCEMVCISVVDRIGSSGRRRPFESIKCDAKMVLMSVDLPRPV